MKNLKCNACIAALVMVITTFVSCSNDDNQVDETIPSIEGKWNLVEVSGGVLNTCDRDKYIYFKDGEDFEQNVSKDKIVTLSNDYGRYYQATICSKELHKGSYIKSQNNGELILSYSDRTVVAKLEFYEDQLSVVLYYGNRVEKYVKKDVENVSNSLVGKWYQVSSDSSNNSSEAIQSTECSSDPYFVYGSQGNFFASYPSRDPGGFCDDLIWGGTYSINDNLITHRLILFEDGLTDVEEYSIEGDLLKKVLNHNGERIVLTFRRSLE